MSRSLKIRVSASAASASGRPANGSSGCARKKRCRDGRRGLSCSSSHAGHAASSSGPVSFAIRHTLSPTAEGTRLRAEVDVTLGRLMRLAAHGPLKVAEREFRGDFARLKELLEAAPTAGPVG